MSPETLELMSILSGPVGIIVGIIISEVISNSHQRFIYLEEMFKKKLEIYEGLFKTMQEAYNIGREVINNKEKLSKKERLDRWNSVVGKTMEYIEKNTMYINEYVKVHCGFSIIGVEEVADLSGEDFEKAKDKYLKNWQKTEILIRKESGIERLNGFLSKINNSKNSDDYRRIMKIIKKDYID